MKRAALGFAAAHLAFGCGNRIAQTAEESAARGDSGTETKPVTCGPALSDRLRITRIGVDYDVRYKRAGYDNLPDDERLALAIDPGGEARLAWLDEEGRGVHVTPLTKDLQRRGPDTIVEGADIGGLVAHGDGFALVTRRIDPGEPLADPAAGGAIATAAILVRVRQGTEVFAAPLTGTTSITAPLLGATRDCAPLLASARLAYNGTKYGAYFPVHGCAGDEHAPYYGDKLVYADDSGSALPGGWNWNCSINRGIQLLPGAATFTALCLSDGAPSPGLNWVTEGKPPTLLAPEARDIGYSAGRFGSAVDMGGGDYVVAWLSRGAPGGGPTQAEKPAADIALVRFSENAAPSDPPRWVLETPDIAEANLHVAPYGPERLLIVWDAIDGIRCDVHTCFGDYAGTHFRLTDANGVFLSPDERIPAPPSSAEDIAVFPNGDLGWAFVDDMARDYSRPIAIRPDGTADVPPMRTISVARLTYCP